MHDLVFDEPELDKFDDDQARALTMLSRLTGRTGLRALKAAEREVRNDLYTFESRLSRMQHKIDTCIDSGVSMAFVEVIGGLRSGIQNSEKTLEGISRSLFGLKYGFKGSAKETLAAINATPGVVATGTYDGNFAVAIWATYVCYGTTYDLGTWLLVMEDPARREKLRHAYPLETIEVRSAVRSEWRRNGQFAYPYYGLNGDGFCYGSNEDLIVGHVFRGSIQQAVVVAMTVLSSVNDSDVDDVPLAFDPIHEKSAP